MTDHQLIFKGVLAQYYKTERKRSEECLGAIIDILQTKNMQEAVQIEMILERLISHYQRETA